MTLITRMISKGVIATAKYPETYVITTTGGAPGIEWLLPESVCLKGGHTISQGVEKFLQDTGNAQTGPNKKSSSSSMVSIPGTLLS